MRMRFLRHFSVGLLPLTVMATLHGCMASGVESQRVPVAGSPGSPWSGQGTPYLDPNNQYSPGNTAPSTGSPSVPSVTVPSEGSVPSIPGGVDQNCYKSDAFTCAIERSIFDKTNAYRAQRGLRPLKFGWHLGYAARNWSMQQASRGGISHAGFPGARERFLATEFGPGLSFDVSGENVAYTGYSSGSVESIASDFAEMWWNSAGHRRNMLGNYDFLGVGVYRSGRSWFATQIFGEE